MCGGTRQSAMRRPKPNGLSPRVRGNHQRESKEEEQAGSIPACAGEPRSPLPLINKAQVYPRVCGGTSAIRCCEARRSGLSPRVRGNPLVSVQNRQRAGSIPACAGEPQLGHFLRRPHAVYPRVCGGTRELLLIRRRVRGLSPRVRGNRSRTGQAVPTWGSIPACAGEPPPWEYPPPPPGVYPRVCGGTVMNIQADSPEEGLSPRVRGNPIDDSIIANDNRSIPACAGEPATARAGGLAAEVYPRVCGGTVGVIRTADAAGGLSPRVRGNPRGGSSETRGNRSIPACAGEP